MSNGAGSGNRNSVGKFDPTSEEQGDDENYTQSPEKGPQGNPNFDRVSVFLDLIFWVQIERFEFMTYIFLFPVTVIHGIIFDV